MRIPKQVFKHTGLCCILLFGASFITNANATEPSAENALTPAQVDLDQASNSPSDNEVLNNSMVASSINTQECPDTFYSITLPTNGKLCQVFAAELPASMIFYVPQAPSEVLQYFQQEETSSSGTEQATVASDNRFLFGSSKQVKNRYLLQSDDKNTTIIVSADGEGTQVDVLVKDAI